MKRLVREWVEKAEADYATARRERRARSRPNLDAACFHAQQCAEKYLKARLQEAGVSFPKTHDLAVLLNLALPMEPGWSPWHEEMSILTSYAVTFRYPGASATKAMARQALLICGKVRLGARTSLGVKTRK